MIEWWKKCESSLEFIVCTAEESEIIEAEGNGGEAIARAALTPITFYEGKSKN